MPRPPALTLTTSPLQSFARLSAQWGCDDCQHLMPSLPSAWKSVRDTPPWFLCFCSSSQLVPMPGLNASPSPCFLNQFCMVGKYLSNLYLFSVQTLLPFDCLQERFGEGIGTPLQYSCLENPMDGGAWWAAVRGVAKSQTRLSDFTFTFHLHTLEKEMATHSSVLAWRIPGTGETGGLPSMGSQAFTRL